MVRVKTEQCNIVPQVNVHRPHAKLNDVRAMNYLFKQFSYCLVSDVSSEATIGQSG